MEERDIDRYITDHKHIEETYFTGLLADDHGTLTDYIQLHYVYFLLRSDRPEEAQEKFSGIPDTGRYGSFRQMLEGMIAFYALDDKGGITKLVDSAAADRSNKWVRLELFYMLLDNEEEYYKAWGYLEEALAIDENYYEARYAQVSHYDAIENCHVIIDEILRMPQTFVDEEVLNLLGFAYYNAHETGNAGKIINGSLAVKETGRAYYLLGQLALDEDGDEELALEYFNRSIALGPETDVIRQKASVLADLGRTEEAEEAFLSLFGHDKTMDSYSPVIFFYLKTKNMERAAFYISESEQVNGKNYLNEGYKIVLDHLSNTGDTKSAVKSYASRHDKRRVDWLRDTFGLFEG